MTEKAANRVIITTDLHLTAKPSEEYRWGLLDWLMDTASEHGAEEVWILGDVTDAKDNHPAKLVNRLVISLTALAEHVGKVRILMGNHDCIDPKEPFFMFLATHPKIEFYTDRTELLWGRERLLWLPHTRTPEQDWKDIDPSAYDLILMHESVKGAKASNGQQMDGVYADFFGGTPVLSGDIHVPQAIGTVTYVGSPYHVHFGDSFEPRLFLAKAGGKPKNLHYPYGVGRHSLRLTNPEQLRTLEQLHPGDHIKVTLRLPRNKLLEWEQYKRQIRDVCAELGLHLYGITTETLQRRLKDGAASEQDRHPTPGATPPLQALEDFSKAQGLGDDLHNVGKSILEEVLNQ